MLEIGLTGELREIVLEEKTAYACHSGGLKVYATPAMITLMERAAYESVEKYIEEGYSTVGTKVDIKHLSATPIGMEVSARAKLVEIDNRRLVFEVEAFDKLGKIGEGKHERFIIDIEKFQAKTDNKNLK